MDFKLADHLPNISGGSGHDPETLPRQRRGITPQMHGRFPDYDVMEGADRWDDVTRRVVERRLQRFGALRTFDADQAITLRAFCDIVTDQYREPRVDVLGAVDETLANGVRAGYRYEGMPDDAEVWRIVARGLDHAAERESSFALLERSAQSEIVGQFADAKLSGGPWSSIDVSRAWQVVMRDVLTAFYAHPWTWNEIGFGGPAYPRGYARLGIGLSEAWEGDEAVSTDPGHSQEHTS